MTPEIYLTAGALVLSGVVWLVRLEGKVKAQDRLLEQQDKRMDLLQEKHETFYTQLAMELAKIRECLARMEGRLGFDRMGGHVE